MYAMNDNTGYLSGDPHDYLFLDIDEAKSGKRNWLTYDQMRKRASGEWYDCFTDETCYGYNWDYDMEHFIPARKEYANQRFYNDRVGEVDFYDMFKQYVSYGDWPNFEDDEWWYLENDIMRDGEDQYHYFSPITQTKEFRKELEKAIYTDDDLAAECENSEYSFEEICEMTAYDICNYDFPILLRENVIAPGYNVWVDQHRYIVDGDLVWDAARSYIMDEED